MGANYHWNAFSSRTELAQALATKVSDLLAAAIEKRGTAFLAVSGGTTPAEFLAALSRKKMAWDKVTVTLVDERFVPASSPRSNAGLIKARLLQNEATTAHFVPLYRKAESVADAAICDDAQLRSLPWPLDVVILGMGTDGHTASFFPDADNLDTLLDPASTKIVLPVNAPSAGEPRLTLAAARIAEARFVALHIEGENKRAAFEQVMAAGAPKPVRAMIEALPKPVEVFWAD